VLEWKMTRVLITLSIIALGIAFLTIPSVQQFGRRLLTSSEKISLPARSTNLAPGAYSESDVSLDLVTLLGFDAIPAILDPRFVSPVEAAEWMDPDEQVQEVSINGESRAYTINMLSRHEIVNDVVGGAPIAVTW
jgi:hypothetical protein